MEKTYKTKNGKVLRLRTLSNSLYVTLNMQWDKKKPQAPIQDVEINGHIRQQRNYSEPTYLDELEVWKYEKSLSIAQYILGGGVLNNPSDEDPDFVELHKGMFPEITDVEMRYHWVASLLSNEEETQNLSLAILSQSQPTEEGIALANERFQSDGERGRRDAVATPTSEGEKAAANGQYLNPVAT